MSKGLRPPPAISLLTVYYCSIVIFHFAFIQQHAYVKRETRLRTAIVGGTRRNRWIMMAFDQIFFRRMMVHDEECCYIIDAGKTK